MNFGSTICVLPQLKSRNLMNTVMGLKMSSEDILSLENRTEGWAAGLKFAAISMRGKSDPAEFIRTFTGSNRYIMDYLIDEVLSRTIGNDQKFPAKHFNT